MIFKFEMCRLSKLNYAVRRVTLISHLVLRGMLWCVGGVENLFALDASYETSKYL